MTHYRGRAPDEDAPLPVIATLTANPSLDTSTSVDRVVPDDKLRAERPRREPGGGGINVARAIGRLGGEAVAVHTRGGRPGETLEALLRDEGLATVGVAVEGETRENLSITESATGQQFRFVMPGPELEQAEWGACLERVGGLDPRPDWLVASGSLPPGAPDDAYGQVARRCAAASVPVILDTSGEALRHGLDAGVFLVKPNLGELASLIGAPLEGDRDVAAAVAGIVEDGGAEYVLVSLGAGGAYVAGRDLDGIHLRAPTVPIRSKVGAGDSMVGGLVLALARGAAIVDAARFGVAAGAAAVMTEGSELCRREDTERLFAQMTDG